MIIKPKTRGFICVTAHPAGCAKNVGRQAGFAAEHAVADGPRRVLVIGSSTGFGLAGRIAAAFGCGADTVGVFLERPSSKGRTATAGWYNNLAFEKLAADRKRTAISINGDAFSNETKSRTIDAIRNGLPGGQVDLILYSLAAPKRADPDSGQVYNSVIKPIGHAFKGKTLDFHTGSVSEAEIAPANEEEIADTVRVMGGADWLLWIRAMTDAGVLSGGAVTLALSYIGPELTHAIYKDGTIGKAKEDLEQKAMQIDALLSPIGGKAFISVNKALVTQASAAIPVVPLYVSLLFKVMKRKGVHEDCVQQMVRLFHRLYPEGSFADWSSVAVDDCGRIRMDDWEMRQDVQRDVAELWSRVSTENAAELSDLQGYRDDFYRLFGFNLPDVDYEADVIEF